MSVTSDSNSRQSDVLTDEGLIREGLRCESPGCDCQRPRGKVHCPLHDADKTGDPNISVDTSKNGEPLVCCHPGTGETQAELIEALRELDLWPTSGGAKVTITRRARGREVGRIVFHIRDENGTVVARKTRIEFDNGDKTFFLESRNADGRWARGLNGMSVEDLPLFGAEKLKDLPDGATVVVVEGEKAAKALMDLGIPAVGTVTGAQVPKDKDKQKAPSVRVLRVLRRFDVVLWADNDDAGRDHMRLVAERLLTVEASA